jgi:voltage-gated potassium channel
MSGEVRECWFFYCLIFNQSRVFITGRLTSMFWFPRNSDPEDKSLNRQWQLALRRFFHQIWVEISIGVLVVISVTLTLSEFWLEAQLATGLNSIPTLFGELTQSTMDWMVLANDLITTTFVVELTLRFLAARSKKRFFSEFWLDIIATLPLFRVFRASRALRLLRLGRLFRLFGVMSRLSGHYPAMFRRGILDFLLICGLLVLTVLFGTLAITHFENSALKKLATSTGKPIPVNTESTEIAGVGKSDLGSENQFNLNRSFWFSIYTLFAGEPIPNAPRTLSGKIVSVFLMFMGLTIFAIFAGTVSAFMVDRMRMEGRVVDWDALQNHIIICGWTPKTLTIIEEYRASSKTRRMPIVVITEMEREQLEEACSKFSSVYFLHDDFTKVTALERAGISQAKTCLVLTDTSGGRSEQDADARTILAALTVEKLNESVYTCAEIVNRSYATHLEDGKVNDFVVSGEYGAHMLAQAGMNKGLVGILGELMTYQHGNEFYRLPVPDSWVGASFDEKLTDVKKSSNIILVAVHSQGDSPVVNPKSYYFRAEDDVVLISDGVPKLS